MKQVCIKVQDKVVKFYLNPQYFANMALFEKNRK